jgi:hypothetical protein
LGGKTLTDVALAIDAEAVLVTFQPPAVSTYDSKGNAVPGVVPAPISGMAAIQPVSGRMLQDLPEGLRAEVSMVGWSRTTVAFKWEVVYANETYRVIHTWPRPSDGFTKFAMKRAQG